LRAARRLRATAKALAFTFTARRLALLCACALLAAPAGAEEVTVLGGATDTDDHTSASYAWGLEYRQRLLAHLDGTLTYLNEGHIPGHHRDGAALQLWGTTTLWQQRVQLALGAGPYVYCDTQSDAGADNDYRDYHGVGALVTGSLSYALAGNWFARLEISQVVAPGNVGTRTVMLGVGYRLQSVIDRLNRSWSDTAQAAPPVTANELGLFYGQTIINSFHADASSAFGLEYRRRILPHLELSASLIDDGDGLDGHHMGMTGEAWLVQDFMSGRVMMGVGVGTYFSFESYQTVYGIPAASTVGLASMTVAWRFTRSLDLRLIWHRGFTGDDQDRDIVTTGLGWRF
jgi:hypothetical protein